MLCVRVRGGGVGWGAEGLVSVKLSSSCMSDRPRLRPNVEYRQERRKRRKKMRKREEKREEKKKKE